MARPADRFDARAALRAIRRDSWVRPFLRTHGGVLALAVGLSVLASIFAAALMFASGFMISLAASIPLTVLALHIPSLFVRIFGIGKPILQYFERLASHDWVLRMTSSLRRRLYEAVERRPPASSVGRALGMFADDLENLQNLCLRTLFPMIGIAVTYVLVVVAFGALSPLMGALMLVVVGIAAFAMPFWALSAAGAREQRRRRIASDAYEGLAEDVFGVVDWALSGRRDDFLARLRAPYEAAWEQTRRYRAFLRALSVLRQALYAACIVGVLAWASFAFFGAGGAAPDGFVVTEAARDVAGTCMHDSAPFAANWIAAFVLCLFPLLDVFSPATEAVLGIAEHAPALESLNALSQGGERGADAHGHGADAHGQVEPPAPCRGEGCAIELDGVGFAYGEGEQPVLSDVRLRVRRGARIALVGRSGAGKTTLLDIMGGTARPTAGEARRCGSVGRIEQFPYVFRKSLRENMLLANPKASDADIACALRKVGLGGLLARLPGGLDALMAEGGATLSGGERHRLALARILLHDCDIVLLDEPYLGLDDATREAVSQTMLEALAGKTVVLVTHSASQARGMDAVYRVEGGTVALSK